MIHIEERRFDYAWWRDPERYAFRQLRAEFDPELSGILPWQNAANTLDKVTSEFLTIAIDAVAKHGFPFIDAHIHAALDLGASARQVYEVANICGVFGGLHASGTGHNALARVILERQRLNEPFVERRPERDSHAAIAPLAEGQAWVALLRKHDRARLDVLQNWSEKVLAIREIDPRTQQLIVVAISTLLNLSPSSLEAQIQLGLDLGCGSAEMVEAIMTAALFEGVGAAECGLAAFYRVTERQRQP